MGNFAGFTLDVFLVRFLLSILAIWRLAHAFSMETGPFGWFENAREWLITRYGFDSWQAEFGRCPLCQSIWLGLILEPVFFGFVGIGDFILLWISLSGSVTLLQLIISK